MMNEIPYTEKPASFWDIPDIENLIGQEEGAYLEFKRPSESMRNKVFSRDELITNLAETVSAFLNSDGGVILVGVQTDKVRRDSKVELLKSPATWATDGTFESLGILLKASQVRDFIYGNIMPKPSGVEVKALDLQVENSKTTVFVVTVPRSPTGAHQSTKTRLYYRRTSDGDEPMLDYEIRDVNNRRAGPILYLTCRVYTTAVVSGEEEWRSSYSDMSKVDRDSVSFHQVDLVFAATNIGYGTANIARFDIGIPIPWGIERYSPDDTNVGTYWTQGKELAYLVGDRVTVFWTPEKCQEIPIRYRDKRISEKKIGWQKVVYSGNQPPSHPIWAKAGRMVIGVVRLERPIAVSGFSWSWLPWRVLADDMLETRGAILLRESDEELYVDNYSMDDVCWCGQAEDLQIFEDLKQRFQVT